MRRRPLATSSPLPTQWVAFGADSQEMMDQLLRLTVLEQLLWELDRRVGLDKTVVVLPRITARSRWSRVCRARSGMRGFRNSFWRRSSPRPLLVDFDASGLLAYFPAELST